MSLIVPNVGEVEFMKWSSFSTDSPEAIVMKLFQNDYTPVATSVAGSFTEATFTDYSTKTLAIATWSTPATDGNGKAASEYPDQTWTAGSAQTIHGYFCVAAISGILLFAQRFDDPRPLESSDTLTITPKFTFRSEN